MYLHVHRDPNVNVPELCALRREYGLRFGQGVAGICGEIIESNGKPTRKIQTSKGS